MVNNRLCQLLLKGNLLRSVESNWYKVKDFLDYKVARVNFGPQARGQPHPANNNGYLFSNLTQTLLGYLEPRN